MQFALTMNFDTLTALNDVVRTLAERGLVPSVTTEAPKPPRAKKDKSADVVTDPTHAHAVIDPVHSHSIPTPPTTPTSDPEYKKVAEATMALSKARGREAVVTLLTQFGVDHANKLPREKWAGYIAAATAAKDTVPAAAGAQADVSLI